MSEVSFAEFYQSVHGRDPFPWQERLAALALAGDWPEAIAVPTGCGKTSVIDVAVYALAAQAESAERMAPIRIFFVVDRRLVVDDVHAHAVKLATAIKEGKAEWARGQLSKFGACSPLDVAVLRGGMYRSDTWADAPNQPLVCVSTVDQVGSRLLFRGYGVSDSQRPVHAGLVGNDSLVIVDEAHLSQPFLDTLGRVQRYQGDAWREKTPAPPLRFVKMSATVEGAFGLTEEDLECDRLKPRIEAKKLAQLKEVANVPQAAAEEAGRLRKNGASVVAVILNTVAAARAAFEQLGGDKVLLTGRVRPYDRDRLIETFIKRMCAGRKPRYGEPLFVVATQTVEVGADLDFDALVTEAAPMDALRQRFGRLDRLGSLGTTHAVILRSKRAKEKDWVYGGVAEQAWAWLTARGSPVDFGIQGLPSWPMELNTRRGVAPLLFPAHLDTWAQTNPVPAADPDVAPFLHGSGPLDSDVQIVWRADLESDDPEDWKSILEAVPPLATEALPVPIRAAKRWLWGEGGAVADVEGVASQEEEPREEEKPLFLIWRGPEKSDERQEVGGIRPGDTIVVRSSAGGCDRFGWNPNSKDAVRDIGDQCANKRAESGGGKSRFRIHPEVLYPNTEESETRKELKSVLKRVAEDEEEADEKLDELITRLLGRDWVKRNYGAGTAVLAEAKRRKPRPKTARATSEIDETDEDDSSSFTVLFSLDKHTKGVVAKVRTYTEKCGLKRTESSAVLQAAELHDLGKWDARFQLKLGNTRLDEPLAKSLDKRKRDSEYPKGARHEFASVALTEAGAVWPEECDRELALYLIGTHHGYGRPFAPVWENGDYEIEGKIGGRPVAVRDVYRVARIDSGWADRYWMLTRKYGWWGLAYLETMVRRADCVRSREEEEEQWAKLS